MIRLILCVFIFTCIHCVAQTTYPVTDRGSNDFVFVGAGTDSSGLTYIKTLQCTGKKGEDVSMPYKVIKKEAKLLGANCFRLRGFSRNDQAKTITLTLAVYSSDEMQRRIIVNNQESNQIFLFSDDRFNDKKTTFQVNGDRIEILSGHYYKYALKPGEEIRISKGGFTGASMKLKWIENGACRFFTIDGFHMVNAPVSPTGAPATFGVYSSTGKITELDYNLGFLLSEILTLQKDTVSAQ